MLRKHIRLERQGMKNKFEQRTSYSRKLVTKRMIVTLSKIMMLHDFLYMTHFHPLTIAIKFFVSHCQTDSNKFHGDGIMRKRNMNTRVSIL